MSKSPVCRSLSLILVLVLALVVAPLAAPPRVQAAPPPVPRQATQRSYPDGGLTPPGPIDASTATTTFSVSPGDFADNTWVSEVTIDLAFAKVGGGICPGPGGARDWAEEIRFRLFAPDGTMVSLVRFNDYVSSNPDVGQVTVTFDDDAAQPVAGLSIQDGTFRPSLGAMADFNGLDPDGVWTLELSDQWLDDPLCFVGATLHITAIFWPDLAIVKTDGPDPAIAGQDLFYSLTVCNNGLGTAGGVVMTDTLPGAVTYLDDSGGCTLHAGDQLVCPMPDLDPGASHSIQVRTHVPPDAVAAEADGTRILLNTAQVASISPDERPADNITSESTYIQDRADLHVTKLAQAGTTIRAGELFTYTIYVDNLGPSCARTVTLNDEILSSGTFELVNLVQDPDRADQCMLGAGGLALDCALDDPLEADGRWTLQLVLRANEAQDVSNLVEVNSATPDPFLDNNRATAFVSVTSVADLDIGKTAIGQTDCDGSPPTIDAVTAGGTVTYTLVARNNGPSTAENMVVQDPMPPSTTIAHVTTTQGLCTQGALWHCYLGSLSPGGSVTMTVVAEVWPSVLSGTVLYNEALVSSDTFDPDNTNNLGTNETTVRTAADLTLLAAPHTGTVTAGDMLTYTLVAYNGGPSNAANIVLRDTLPLSTTMVGVTATQGQCDQYAPRCDLGPLAPGDRVTMTVVAGVWPSVLSGTVLYNEALVSGDTFDPNGSGPISMTTIVLSGVTNRPPTANAGSGQTVLMGALVTLEASGSSDPEGDALTYSWAQTGGTAVALSDPAASQITFTAPNTLGVLTFVLTVTDSQGLAAQDTVEVTVTRHTIYLPLLLKLSLPLTKEYGVKSQLK